MKKFFYPAIVVLALCGANARAAHFQTGGVRVGPAADEAAADATPAPKKDEKKGARAVESGEKNRAPGKSQGASKTQEPAALSNATASTTITPPVKSNPSSTSDAPSKPGSNTTAIPIGSPVKNRNGAEGVAESNKAAAPIASEHTADNASPSASTLPNTTTRTPNTLATPSNTPAAATVSLADVYRIGTGDVLDIRLLNGQDPRQSTLYPIIAGGVLDYPLLHDPLTVTGMTTDELSAQLIAEFRHRGLYERPQVRVSVREYASHAVLISGLVNDPGTKILRREAIPLYVVVAEAQPKPEAGRAVIISHSNGKLINVDLNDATALNTLVQSGDVVTLTVRPPEFFYVGGEIGSPGQKDFHAGLTLTQALLASGGVTRLAGERVRVARAGADGRLVSAEYNLREIEGGAVPDPPLQAGDRIEVQAAARRK
ncbi:MAG: polysaccharide biosynthesis/export protein [Acidobacteriota bacterium]|jgi:protein involved in polysaccharide export with SLBB domain|nr:polysaccharide biosynthesis/export protein [Acidobacteriota bacterium]